MINQFLDVLGGPSAYWHFQTFDDAKTGNKALAKQMYDTYDPLMQKMLVALNDSGAGIFVAVNEHEHNKGRKKTTTTKVRAIFADFDDPENAANQVEQISSVLEPTVVVESSPNKFHVYYVLSNQDLIPVNEFTYWQKHLVKEYGSDPKCTDSSRVMRVPGFKHNKGDPKPVTIVRCSGKKYSLDDLVSAFYGGRNNWLTSHAGRYRRDGLPPKEIADRLADINSRLRVPLDDDEVSRIADNAGNYSPDPERAADYEVATIARELHLETTKDGSLLPNYTNLIKLVEADPSNRSFIWMNTFTGRVEVSADVPWDRHAGETELWSKNDEISFRNYLIEKYRGTEWSRMDVKDVLSLLTTRNHYDPLRQYFDQLEWDGTPRLDTVFQRHLGAEDSHYTTACARNFFLGAARRALYPGCKHDEMVVFYGAEGTGKSSFCFHICPNPAWTTDSIGDLKNKDALDALRGRWIIEMSELKSMQGANAEHVKAFLTSVQDNYRPAYGEYTLQFPRRCIFAGTTNNERFLTESGANRRFLPVEVLKELSIDALTAERDQIWAEAKHMLAKGKLAQVPKNLFEEINDKRLNATDDGEYTGDIARYIEGDDLSDPMTVFNARDFYLATVENASRDKWIRESRLQKQIANAARMYFRDKPDWEHCRFRHRGQIINGWRCKTTTI